MVEIANVDRNPGHSQASFLRSTPQNQATHNWRQRCEPNLRALPAQYDLPVADLHGKGLQRLAITRSRETDSAFGRVHGAVGLANQGTVINGKEVIVLKVERKRHVRAAVLIGVVPAGKLDKKGFSGASFLEDPKLQRSAVRELLYRANRIARMNHTLCH